MVTWRLATFAMGQLNRWQLRIPTAESVPSSTCGRVTAHMLGVQDEYIPASWDEANAQRAQVLAPIVGPTPEGIALADILLDIAQLDLNGDGRSLLRPLHALTRYKLGTRSPTGCRSVEWYWDGLVEWAWLRFVALREGALLLPLSPDIAWAFDEILRTESSSTWARGQSIHIEMPTANRTF